MLKLWNCDPRSVGRAMTDLRELYLVGTAANLADILEEDPEQWGVLPYRDSHLDCLAKYGDPRVLHQARVAAGTEPVVS